MEEFESVVEYWLPEEYHAGLCTEREIGKPKGRIVEARRLAQRATPIAIKALVEVAASSDHSSSRVKAANALLDRGWGRPEGQERQVITVESHTRSIEQLQDEMPWLSTKRLSYRIGTTLAEDIEAKRPDAATPAEPAASPEAAPFAPVDRSVARDPGNASTESKADIRKDYGPRGSAH